MANRPTWGPPQAGGPGRSQGPTSPCGAPARAPAARLPSFTEPEMRRWPHPPEPALPLPPPPGEGAEPELVRLLARQTQLLAEIKALLEHPVPVQADAEEPPTEAGRKK